MISPRQTVVLAGRWKPKKQKVRDKQNSEFYRISIISGWLLPFFFFVLHVVLSHCPRHLAPSCHFPDDAKHAMDSEVAGFAVNFAVNNWFAPGGRTARVAMSKQRSYDMLIVFAQAAL
jgi:hypothetical protein